MRNSFQTTMILRIVLNPMALRRIQEQSSAEIWWLCWLMTMCQLSTY